MQAVLVQMFKAFHRPRECRATNMPGILSTDNKRCSSGQCIAILSLHLRVVHCPSPCHRSSSVVCRHQRRRFPSLTIGGIETYVALVDTDGQAGSGSGFLCHCDRVFGGWSRRFVVVVSSVVDGGEKRRGGPKREGKVTGLNNAAFFLRPECGKKKN